MEKVSVILTIKDAEHELPELLTALELQSRPPDEVLFSDASEHERCRKLLKDWKPAFPVKILRVAGNRSFGRNKAIEMATFPLIAITDAGCVPHPKWLQRIIRPFRSSNVQIVSGFTLPRAKNVWQEVAGAYFLIMPERIRQNYLPATRSMAIRKDTWASLGGFPEHLELSEDYAFAQHAKAKNISMKFVSDAIVEWNPPTTLREIGRTVYKLAWWDAMGGVVRIKTLTIFIRYVIFFLLFLWNWQGGLIALVLYMIWAWRKNARYVRWPSSIVVLPVTQVSTDMQVMCATISAFYQRRKRTAYNPTGGGK